MYDSLTGFLDEFGIAPSEGRAEAIAREMEPTDAERKRLDAAKSASAALYGFYERRRRSLRYVTGDQWSDRIDDGMGGTTTEENYLRERGRLPVKMNHLSVALRALTGQYRQNRSERAAFGVDRDDEQAAEMATLALRAIQRTNQHRALEADSIEEMIISGVCVFRIGYKPWASLGRDEVRIDRVPTDRFFWNPDTTDRRLIDMDICGQVHDMDPAQVVSQFGQGDVDREEAIEGVYGGPAAEQLRRYVDLDERDIAGIGQFYGAPPAGLWRVVEVWQKIVRPLTHAFDPETGGYGRVDLSSSEIQEEQRARREVGHAPLEIERSYSEVWTCTFYAPNGEVLWRGETPYAHGEHPYVIGFGQFLDGRPAGLIEDIIDQQRLYNRQISTLDQILATSARGVLMIPEEMLPDGVSPEDFAESYTRINGVIVYQAMKDGKMLPSGVKPEQVFNSSLPAGAFEWLGAMRDNLEYTSGVRGAQLGQSPKSGVSNALYQSQIAQGSITSISLFENFFETVRALDIKTLRTAMQFWTEPRPLRTAGGQPVVFDPARVRDFNFDVALASTADTATSRMMFEEDLKEFVGAGHLSFPEYLEVSGHPKAQTIQAVMHRMRGQMPAAGLDPAALALLASQGGAAGSGQQGALAQLQAQ